MDANCAGCPDTQRSTFENCVFFGDSLVLWSSKRQPTVSRSSAEVEYHVVANVVADTCWLCHLLGELLVLLPKAKVIFCDNVPDTYLAANQVQHKHTKHIVLDVYFVREKVQLGQLRVLHVPTTEQFANIMTKGLPTSAFQDFHSSLCITDSDASAVGGVERDISVLISD